MSVYLINSTDRNFGLDVVRSIAIISVVVGHAVESIIPQYSSIINIIDGVDLFFVLSGFLIGNILLKHNSSNLYEKFKSLKTFIIRRWFRTLPNYYIFLVVNILLVEFGIYSGIVNHNSLAYFVFMQNLYIPLDLFFWESWSLAVEEWFYLLLPMLILLLSLFNKISKYKLNSYLLSSIFLVLAPVILRFVIMRDFTGSTDLYLRKIVVFRLDSLAWGLLLAYFNINYYEILKKYRYILFLVFASGMILIKTNGSVVNPVIKYTLLPIFIMQSLPFFYHLKNSSALLRKIFTQISLHSYSAYLIHLPVLYILLRWPSLNSDNVFLFALLYFSGTVALSMLNYRFFEKPMMNLRNKFS